MSSRELLKQVKALGSRARERFLDAVLLTLEEKPSRAPGKARRVKWPNVEKRAKRIVRNKVLPNLVLLEREQETY